MKTVASSSYKTRTSIFGKTDSILAFFAHCIYRISLFNPFPSSSGGLFAYLLCTLSSFSPHFPLVDTDTVLEVCCLFMTITNQPAKDTQQMDKKKDWQEARTKTSSASEQGASKWTRDITNHHNNRHYDKHRSTMATINKSQALDPLPGPPVPRYHNNSWKLISQGAEARVWLVPNYLNTSSDSQGKTVGNSCNVTTNVICKERFPKAYRHPSLDETLTKSRTRAEARNLNRCRRQGVSVPVMLGIDMKKNNNSDSNDIIGDGESNVRSSACLFMEYVCGCTVRNFLNVERNENDEKEGKKVQDAESQEPLVKRQKVESNETMAAEAANEKTDNSAYMQINNNKIITRLDEAAQKVAYSVGAAIGKMHNANVIHGDLTTSNILLRNPPKATKPDEHKVNNDWKPDIVLIDFGLSSTSTNSNSHKKAKTSNHEERAVDLYVLERAFITTHVGSEDLVKEVMRGYKASCQSSDAVFVRLAQVRLRGRKRECFG